MESGIDTEVVATCREMHATWGCGLKILLPGFNCTFDEWLCDSFVELIEEMELWKWDDASGNFWSRLAKALQQSNISVKWAEQLDSRLASVHSTRKMSFAAATRSIRECKMRIERIGGSHLQRYGVSIKQHGSWCGQEKQPCERAFPGSIPAETPSTQISMDLSRYTLKQGF